jgi:hypothetical protein
MPVIVANRSVYVRQKSKSQTVSICDADNQWGDYDWRVRLFHPEFVTEAEVAARSSVEDLIRWLRDVKHGEIEKEPPPSSDGDASPPPPAPPEDGQWVETAVAIVEQVLDQLVFEFLRAPYLHRVEHSLHARLFAILAAQPHFDRNFVLNDGRTVTQPIHKEWPETIPEEGHRRGSFDLVILPPGLVGQSSVQAFRTGRIAAPIVIEMGLDYGAGHLMADAEKLINSRVQHGYLVHFTRLGPDRRAEQLVLDPGAEVPVQAAYANTGSPACYKLVRGTTILGGGR